MMNYEETLKSLQEYFADLIILQYRYAPENRTLIKNLVNLIFANNLALQIRDLTVDVENSFGYQLDIVGKWVGVDRYYDGEELWNKKYFSMPLYSTIQDSSYKDYQGGFSNYTNFADNDGAFLTYKNWQNVRSGNKNSLGDEYFRQLIKLKIIKNSINHTCKNIDEAIFYWSGGELDILGNVSKQGLVYTTWGDMEITYHYDPLYSDVIKLAQAKRVLPAPTGCTINIEETE